MAAAAIVAAGHNPDQTNYRTMGRGSGGVFKSRSRRFRRDPNASPTPSSIPTKFETVLYKNNRGEKGFGSSSGRFSAPPRPIPSDVDGVNAGMIHGEALAPNSVGQRGSGSFASRVPRLRSAGKRAMPGPGAYNIMPGVRSDAATSSTGAELPSAAFALPGTGNPAKWNERPAPGPGEYDHPGKGLVNRGGAVIPRAREESENARASYLALTDQQMPGPGEYEVRPPSARTAVQPKKPEASAQKVAPILAQASQLRAAALSFGGVAEKQSKVSPGPGEYDPLADAAGTCSAKGTSSFQTGNSHHPRCFRPVCPGPGDYDWEVPAVDKTIASFAASPQPRFPRDRALAPGPAYYQPQSPKEKKSFHLNIQKTWLS